MKKKTKKRFKKITKKLGYPFKFVDYEGDHRVFYHDVWVCIIHHTGFSYFNWLDDEETPKKKLRDCSNKKIRKLLIKSARSFLMERLEELPHE